jgi:hypothetical protein
MTEHPSDRARCKAMAEGTQDGRIRIAAARTGFNRDLPNRVIARGRQSAMISDFVTMPLDAFVPMVERGRTRRSLSFSEEPSTAAE